MGSCIDEHSIPHFLSASAAPSGEIRGGSDIGQLLIRMRKWPSLVQSSEQINGDSVVVECLSACCVHALLNRGTTQQIISPGIISI